MVKFDYDPRRVSLHVYEPNGFGQPHHYLLRVAPDSEITIMPDGTCFARRLGFDEMSAFGRTIRYVTNPWSSVRLVPDKLRETVRSSLNMHVQPGLGDKFLELQDERIRTDQEIFASFVPRGHTKADGE